MRRQPLVPAYVRRLFLAPVLALVIFGAQVLAGASMGFTLPAQAAASKQTLNRFNPASDATSTLHIPRVQSAASNPNKSAPKPYTPPRGPLAVPMKDGRVAVDPVAGAHFLGSDGVLELDVPAGAVTTADVKAAGGSMSLLVRQALPPSGSSAGGSGHYSFGTYVVQLLDASGQPAKQGLRQPLSVKLHYDKRAGAMDLQHVKVHINPSLPSTFNLSPPALSPASPSPKASAGPSPSPSASANASPSPSPSAATRAVPAKLGPASTQAATVSAANATLSASLAPAVTPTTGVSFDTDAPVATFGKPDPFQVGLNAGALTASYPIDVPAGPGGFAPPLTLAYDSAAVSGQHNPQGAAPWTGEGWNLSLGSISWAEHQVESLCTYTNACTASTPVWEDSWQLSDPFGTAAELVPPNINVSTYADDSGNAITAQPITWHTAPETRDKVISIQGQGVLGNIAPCFRVFLPNGIMEEFGCTWDSLQYYIEPTGAHAGTAYLANWLLDMIVDQHGNQIHVTYQQDVQTASGYNYERDAVPATVEWDSPGCLNLQAMCTGSSWAPLMRVNFLASHQAAHAVTTGVCAANGSLRCDDPVDLSGSGGLAAPTVQSTFLLNDVQVQTRASSSASWSTLRDYRLSYAQSGPGTITDPVSGQPQSTAGALMLGQMQEIGADGAASMPPVIFNYTNVTEYYEDVVTSPKPSTSCGPSWNTGNGIPNRAAGCPLWSQSYAGNSWYLSSVGNGQGLQQTFAWNNARNNFHGVNGGGSNTSNPFYCNDSSVNTTFPCDIPDDESWSRAVLTSKTNTVVRAASSGSTNVAGTTAYTYQVPYPIPVGQCPSCVAAFYWGNVNDNDYLDFYNYRFTGFSQATVSSPDGSVAVHKFYSTEGIGIYDLAQITCEWGHCPMNDPYWDTANAAHGHEYELDQYDTNGTSLLRKTITQWQATCPPAGVGATPDSGSANWGNWNGNLVTALDHSNPVGVCEVRPQEEDTWTFDGGTTGLHSAKVYTYDSYGRVASETSISNTGNPAIADASGHGNGASWTGGVTEGLPGLISGDAGTAMSFDGLTGQVTAPTLAPLTGDNTRSVELWFSTTSTTQQELLDAASVAVNGQSFAVGVTNNGGIPASGSGPPPVNTPGVYVSLFGDDVLVPGQTLRDGKPHHLVVSLSGTSMYVWIDGNDPGGLLWNGSSWSSGLQAQPFTLPTTPNTQASPLWIGNSRSTVWGRGTSNFNGTIQGAAIFGKVISGTAHAAGSGYDAAVLADAPVAYWPMNDGVGGVSPSVIVSKPQYVWDDNITATSTSASGTYRIDRQAFTDVEDPAGNHYSCTYNSYNGYSASDYLTGSTTSKTLDDLDVVTRAANCGTAANGYSASGAVTNTYAYWGYGSVRAQDTPDGNAGIAGHTGCYQGSYGPLSVCDSIDSTFAALPISTTNALNQTTTTGYSAASAAMLADSSGNSNQATLSGGVTPGVAGPVSGDTAMALDGSSGYAQAPASSSLNVAGAMTIEAWVQRGSATGPISSGISGKCIDAANDSTANGNQARIWDCIGTDSENWATTPDGTIRFHGKCLDISGGGTANGTLVQLWDCWGGPGQQWKAGANGSLVNPNSGRCLDDTNSSTTNGTQLQIWDCTGNSNQNWSPAGAGPIVEYNSGSAWGVHFWNWPNPSQLWVNFSDTSGTQHGVQSATGLLQVGQWAHVVATYDGTYGTLYVNGAQVAQANLGSFTPQTSYPVNIGRRPSGSPAFYFAGGIGQVAIYKGALSTTRVAAHHSAATSVPSYTSAVKTDSPVAYYRMDDGGGATTGFGLWPITTIGANGQTTTTTYDALGRQIAQSQPAIVRDATGNGRQATGIGGLTYGATGLVGGLGDSAMGFDGSSAEVDSTYTQSGATAYSVEAWVQTNDSGPNRAIVQDRGGNTVSAPGQSLTMGLNFVNTGLSNPGAPFFLLDSDGIGIGVQSTKAINDGKPHHVVGTWSAASGTAVAASQFTLYVDGAAVATTAISTGSATSPLSGSGGTKIGRHDAWNTNLQGTVGQAALYTSALSAARVAAHYAAGSSYASVVLADAPAAYYRLNDTGGLSQTQTTYTDWCLNNSTAQTPCVEIDKTERINATTSVTSRGFYDGLGHLVETRVPAPSGDIVRYQNYDVMGRLVFQSVPYLVSAYTGGPGPSAFSTPDSSQVGTTYTYDGLGRQTSVTDALSDQSKTSFGIACGTVSGDGACYEQTLALGPNKHQKGTLVDALGRTTYEQLYTGSVTYAVYATTRYTYDYLGDLVQVLHPDGATKTTYTYDALGRKTSMSDPDRGSETYSYDPDGNLVQSVDARGAAGTTYIGYDGLDRVSWRNTSNTSTGAYDTYTYDSVASGNVGVGRLTSETFSGAGMTGSESYVYDGRGRQTSSTLQVGASSYALGTSYDDAGNVLTETYPTGEVVTNTYGVQGWLSSTGTISSGGTTTGLMSNIGYTNQGGAFGEMTSAALGTLYSYTATYDPLDRATDLKVTNTGGSTTFFDQARTFDKAGNVSSATTTLPTGTDNQQFCYDEQDRLTWAGSVGTPSCSTTAITAGTLTAAQYQQSFTYDTMGRLTSGPQGTYTYGSTAHVHAATAAGTAYSAAYDAAGNMTCRAPSSSTTCSGTQTASQLTYDNEGELTTWQDKPTSPSTQAGYLYDGQGERVAQQVTASGATTTTVYVGDVEEVATSSSGTQTTTYYYANGKRIAVGVNGTISFLASDGLGSAAVTLSGSSAAASAAQLYAPYGGMRYSSGAMPGSYGFTGQRQDATTGLDYLHARYLDPVLDAFTSADTVLPGGSYDILGLSRYAYVEGNPVGRTDPTGRMEDCGGSCAPDPCANGGCNPGPPADPCGGDCSNNGGGGTTYNPQPPDPAPSPPNAPVDRCGGDCGGSTTQAQQTYIESRQRINRTSIPQLLEDDRAQGADWSSMGGDAATALVYLSMGGDPAGWCASAKCRQGMAAAQRYIGNLQDSLATALSVAILIYRGGSRTADNMTPRPGRDTTGLSTFDNIGAFKSGTKVQVIDTGRFKVLVATPDAPPEGHVSVAPSDAAEVEGWAATRGTGTVHPLTEEILGAIIDEQRAP